MNTEHCNIHCQVYQGPYITDRLKLPEHMSGSNMHMSSSYLCRHHFARPSHHYKRHTKVSSESPSTSDSAATPTWHQSRSACHNIYIYIYIYIHIIWNAGWPSNIHNIKQLVNFATQRTWPTYRQSNYHYISTLLVSAKMSAWISEWIYNNNE